MGGVTRFVSRLEDVPASYPPFTISSGPGMHDTLRPELQRGPRPPRFRRPASRRRREGCPDLDRDGGICGSCRFGALIGHAELDRLLDAAPTTADFELPALLDTIAQELHDHFAGEEAVTARGPVPLYLHDSNFILSCCAKSRTCSGEIARFDMGCAEQLIGVLLLGYVVDHVATADAAAARFLSGEQTKSHGADGRRLAGERRQTMKA